MKNFIYLSIAIFLLGCSSVKTTECENVMCTQEFRSIGVAFKDASGKAVAVKDYTAVNERTGQSMIKGEDLQAPNSWGSYPVASDSDTKKLSESGDIIVVTAIHPTTEKKVSAEIKVAGGPCACHISKVSGPEEITF